MEHRHRLCLVLLRVSANGTLHPLLLAWPSVRSRLRSHIPLAGAANVLAVLVRPQG